MIKATKGVQHSSDIKDERKKWFFLFFLRSRQTVFFPTCLNVKMRIIDTGIQFLILAGNLSQILKFHGQQFFGACSSLLYILIWEIFFPLLSTHLNFHAIQKCRHGYLNKVKHFCLNVYCFLMEGRLFSESNYH